LNSSLEQGWWMTSLSSLALNAWVAPFLFAADVFLIVQPMQQCPLFEAILGHCELEK
jgi:hypothetical protein